jgi:hypothetical protein
VVGVALDLVASRRLGFDMVHGEIVGEYLDAGCQ